MKKVALLLILVLLAGTLSACFDQLPMLGDRSASAQEGGAQPPPPAASAPPRGEAPPPSAQTPQTEGGSRLGEFEVVEDLAGLRLFDHNLGDSAFLEPIVFTNVLGGESATVLNLKGGEILEQGDGFLFVDGWAIEFYYFARSHEDASQTVVQRALSDYQTDYFFDGSNLVVGPVRTSADHQTAFLAILETLPNGETRLCFYLAQNVPGTNEVVAMEIVLFPGLWGRDDDAILAEVGRHLGVDLAAYLSGFGSI